MYTYVDSFVFSEYQYYSYQILVSTNLYKLTSNCVYKSTFVCIMRNVRCSCAAPLLNEIAAWHCRFRIPPNGNRRAGRWCGLFLPFRIAATAEWKHGLRQTAKIYCITVPILDFGYQTREFWPPVFVFRCGCRPLCQRYVMDAAKKSRTGFRSWAKTTRNQLIVVKYLRI
jgi:hypothetical protein